MHVRPLVAALPAALLTLAFCSAALSAASPAPKAAPAPDPKKADPHKADPHKADPHKADPHANPHDPHAKPAASPLVDLKPFTDGPAAATLTADSVHAHIRHLASEQLGGRGNGEPGLELAAEYIAAKLAEYGLEPAGENGTFFQSFEISLGTTPGPKNRLTLARDGSPVTRELTPAGGDFAAFAGSPDKTTGPLPMVFVGYGITAGAPINYDDYAGLDVKGKIVVLFRSQPQVGDKKSPLNGGELTLHAYFLTKIENARRHGAAGIVFLTPPNGKPEDEPAEIASNAGSVGGGPAAVPMILARRAVFEELFRAAGRDLTGVFKQIETDLKPQSFEFPGVRATLTTDVVRRKATVRNVLAKLPGGDPKLRDEWIVVGGHYDHLGKGNYAGSLSPGSRGKIHYGADDNASGSAAVLELARVFAAQRDRLRRGMMFHFYSGEELGLFGSRHWVDHPTNGLAAGKLAEKVAVMINIDMLGRARDATSISVIGAGSSPVFKADLEALSAGTGVTVRASAGPTFGGSDHMSFERKRIPVLFFHTGLHPDYHRVTDTAEKINAEAEAVFLKLIHKVAWQYNRMDGRPTFSEQKVVASSGGGAGGFRVYFGSIPDYNYDAGGVRLDGVAKGGPADKGGLKAGDVITKIGASDIGTLDDFMAVLRARKPGDEVLVVVKRDKQVLKLNVKLEARGRP